MLFSHLAITTIPTESVQSANYLAFLCLFLIRHVGANYDDWILDAPKEKPLGPWGPWEKCPPSDFVTGIALKMQTEEENHKDEYGISGIELYCGDPGEVNEYKTIRSSVAREGIWSKEVFTCQGYVEGFQLKIDTMGAGEDYAGITAIRLFCTGGPEIFDHYSESVFGQWTEPKRCLKGQAVCGLRTMIKSPYDRGDLVGINSLKMRCCEISDQLYNCFPQDRWEVVFEVDNLLGFEPITYTYTKQVGMTRRGGEKQGGSGKADGSLSEAYTQQHTRKNESTRSRPGRRPGNGSRPRPNNINNNNLRTPSQFKDLPEPPKNGLFDISSFFSFIPNLFKSSAQAQKQNRKRFGREIERVRFISRQDVTPMPVAPMPQMPVPPVPGTMPGEPIPGVPATVPGAPMNPVPGVPVMVPNASMPVMPVPGVNATNPGAPAEMPGPAMGNMTGAPGGPGNPMNQAPGGIGGIIPLPIPMGTSGYSERTVLFYKQGLQVSKSTGFNWETASDETWSPMRSEVLDIKVEPGHYIALYQVVGICGDSMVRPEKFYQNGTFFDPEKSRMEASAYEWRSLSKISKILNSVSSLYQDLLRVGKTLTYWGLKF